MLWANKSSHPFDPDGEYEKPYVNYCIMSIVFIDIIGVHQSPERRLSHTMLTLYPTVYRSRKKDAKVNA
jgi:hypothetical protein